MAFKLPRLQIRNPIVDSVGRATAYFHRFLNVDLIPLIEAQEANQDELIQDIQELQQDQAEQLELIQQALAAANIALETAGAAQEAAAGAQNTADDAGGTAVSGSAFDNDMDIPVSGTAWVQGPQVDLTGVVAGTLTIQGSGPQKQTSTMIANNVSLSGEWRVVEIDGMTETTVFTGNFVVQGASTLNPTIILANQSSGSAQSFSDARTSTGAISYRMDIRRVSGAQVSNIYGFIFARRTT